MYNLLKSTNKVIGWGKTQSDHQDDQLSSILRKADLSIENHDVCHNMYLIYNPITQMCLKGEKVEKRISF